MESDDYYAILGLEKTATDEQIKKSYRKLAGKWHPDLHPHDKEKATKMFAKIGEASEILSDPEKRKLYDQFGKDGLKHREESGMSGSPFGQDPMSFFSQMMGGHMMGGHMMGGNVGKHMVSDVPDCRVQVPVKLEDLYNGATIISDVNRHSFCDKCEGKGSKHGENIECKECKGQGVAMVQIRPGMFTQTRCKVCNGSCIDPKVTKCKKCNGNKFFKETVTMKVKIPKGAYNKYNVVTKGEGNAIPPDEIDSSGTSRSNVNFEVIEKPHNIFKRGLIIPGKRNVDYSDLLIEIEISFVESIVGFYREITHLDGHKITIRHEDPLRHGDYFVIIGQGMPKLDNHDKYGDLFVTILTIHPKEFNFTSTMRKQVAKILTGKEHLVKLPTDLENPVELTSFDKYVTDAKIQSDSDAMKQAYQQRKNKHHIDEGLDTSESDENESFSQHVGGMPVQCAQQ